MQIAFLPDYSMKSRLQAPPATTQPCGADDAGAGTSSAANSWHQCSVVLMKVSISFLLNPDHALFDKAMQSLFT